VSVLGAALLLLVLIEFGIGYGNWQRENALTASGVVTQGVVTNLYSTTGRSPEYWVDYRFRLGTQDDVLDLTGSQTVSQDFYNVLIVGKAISIRYDKYDATVSEIDGQPASIVAPFAIGGLLLIGVVICCVAAIRFIRQKQAQ